MGGMKLLRHPVASMVLFAVLIGLCITIYEGFESSYGFTRGDLQTVTHLSYDPSGNQINVTQTANIVDQLDGMLVLRGLHDLKAISRLRPGATTVVDLLGGLALVGIGFVKTVIGLVTAPFEVVSIVLHFYAEIPNIITELVMLVLVYVFFIVLSLYLNRGDV